MKELGAHVAFNYKTMDTAEVLEKEGPIDMRVTLLFELSYFEHNLCTYRYWDNVGGATLDAALEAAALDARFIVSSNFFIRDVTDVAIRNAE